MVTGSRTDGGTQVLSARVRKTIQSIKEIVGNHSDADIYMTLKESNMDPNETAQKLLNQDPFHEVKRKREKRKENSMQKAAVEPRKQTEIHVSQVERPRSFSGRNVRRGGYTQNALSGSEVSRKFRVVRDNRVNQNADGEIKPASLQHQASSAAEQVNSNGPEKGSSTVGNLINQKHSAGLSAFQTPNGPRNIHSRHPPIVKPSESDTRNSLEEKQKAVSEPPKLNDSQPNSSLYSPKSTSSVLGVYSSSSDPVHVPSLDSRPSPTVGAVGVRRQSSENSVKQSSLPSSSFSNTTLGSSNAPSTETFRSFPSHSKSNQLGQTSAAESVVPNVSSEGRALLGNNQYGSRMHQQNVGHQKVSQPNKEWKPKSSQKSSVNSPRVIGTPKKSVSSPHAADSSKDLEAQLQDKLKIYENQKQNVIIAQHIHVPDIDRYGLTFGSFGKEFDSSRNSLSIFHSDGNAEQSSQEPSMSLSAPGSLSDENSGNNQVELLDDQARNTGSESPDSGGVSEYQLPDKKESSSSHNLSSYADISLVRDTSASYARAEPQHQQDPPELSNFSAYDPQTGYDISYFRPTIEETIRGHTLPSPQEALSSHSANSIPSSTIAMIQQQQPPPMAQMYPPPVHVSHFTNLMPYRQFLSPVYVPPMAMPGYSNNPAAAYPHPSNASSYFLMPGGSASGGLKYGIQQYKPVPGGSPTAFGSFTNPTGYAINASGVVGNATGLDDSSRLKYKDGNLYVPNPQAETSELWIQNPREHPGVQSGPYYNMPVQAPPHAAAAYMPSHTAHASFNAQSSHMQFSSLYHPAQQTTITNPHHLGPTMSGGVGVAGAGPGAQVGAYQQPPQLGHVNWTTNF